MLDFDKKAGTEASNSEHESYQNDTRDRKRNVQGSVHIVILFSLVK